MFHISSGIWFKKKYVADSYLQQTDTREIPIRGKEANFMEKLEENTSVNVSHVASALKAI